MLRFILFVVFLITICNGQSASNSIYWGATMEGPDTYGFNPATNNDYVTAPWAPFDAWNQFQSDAKKNVAIVHWGIEFPAPASAGQTQVEISNFDFTAAYNCRNRGAIPFMDWSTTGWANQQIVDGLMDLYISNVARSIKDNFPHKMFIRLDWEMNYPGFDWGISVHNNTAQSFVEMWRHIHDIVEIQENVTTISWVFCVNQEDLSVINDPSDPRNIVKTIYYPLHQTSLL